MRYAKLTVLTLSILAGCQSNRVDPEPSAIAVSAGKDSAPTYVTAICGECHAVKANAVSPMSGAPGFKDIANSPGLTRVTLATFLSDAHNYPMQMDVDLDTADIEVIADYIITLQTEDYVRQPS